MLDREKVIRGLECITNLDPCRLNEDCRKSGCAYAGTDCELGLMQDALALLREQEAIRPVAARTGTAECYNCSAVIRDGDIYCWQCGRKVKQDG